MPGRRKANGVTLNTLKAVRFSSHLRFQVQPDSARCLAKACGSGGMKISEHSRRCGRVLLAFVLVGGGMACGERRPTDPSPPSTSQPSPPAPSPSSFVVRGQVFEHTPSGMRPVAGVPLRVFKGYRQYPEIVDVTSGADGAYKAGVIEGNRSQGSRFRHTVFSRSMSPLCLGEDRFDVHVVSRAILSTTGIPPSF